MLGLSTQDLDSVLDTVYCLQLVGHRILIASGLELRQFQAFSAWLRQEIDNQSTDAGNADSPEKDTNVDHASTLEYIQGAMTQSELTRFFDLEGDGAHSLRWDLKAEERSLFELYKRELKVESKEGATTKRLPALDALLNHLDDQCSAIFSSITETQKRNVRFGSPTFLGVGTPACMDMRMLIEVRPLFMHIEFDSLIITRPSIPRRLASLLRTSSWDLVPNSVKVRLSNYRLGKY